MIEIINQILSYIADDPSKIKITFTPKENGITVYNILVPTDQIGKIIGKEGKVISSIRTICRTIALKRGEKILLKVEPLPN